MNLEEQIQEALKGVNYPGYSRDIVSFAVVKGVAAANGSAGIDLALTTHNPEVAAQLKAECEAAVNEVRQTQVTAHLRSQSAVNEEARKRRESEQRALRAAPEVAAARQVAMEVAGTAYFNLLFRLFRRLASGSPPGSQLAAVLPGLTNALPSCRLFRCLG